MSLIQEKTTSTEKEPGPSGYREHWSFKYIALIIPLFGLVLLDSGLRLTGIQPPDDPLVFHVKTHMANFTPFVENESGWVTIRPDWVKKDEMYRFTAGTQAGRIFMHPEVINLGCPGLESARVSTLLKRALNNELLRGPDMPYWKCGRGCCAGRRLWLGSIMASKSFSDQAITKLYPRRSLPSKLVKSSPITNPKAKMGIRPSQKST